MIAPATSISIQSGQPFRLNAKRPRFELADFIAKVQAAKPRRVEATYDAARTLADTKNHWVDADSFDADSANSREVRHTLVSRSRHEINNDGYASGIAQTYATDVVGNGPTLRMQTGSEGFNRMVEAEWFAWWKAVMLRRKLWTMAHAKHSDGEGLGVVRYNPKVKHPVKYDVVLYETEQLQSVGLPWEPGYIDGMKFDEFGNPEWYDILRQHPGSSLSWMGGQEPERVRPEFVLLWFKMRRPGQHRGIPDCTSTLNLGAAARRWREATLHHAELIAKFTLFLKTMFQPSDEDLDTTVPLDTLDIATGLMQALPNNVEPVQLDAKQPAQNYDMFSESLINERARPVSMPRNKAQCDSSNYNYASGRLDHQTYYGGLDVDREDCNDLVLDPLFDLWFSEAVYTFGWLGGNPNALSASARAHAWDWPKHPVADRATEAAANDTELKNGTLSLARLYAKNGEDFEDELVVMASNYGVSTDEMRKILLTAIFNAKNQQASMEQAAAQTTQAEKAVSQGAANA